MFTLNQECHSLDKPMFYIDLAQSLRNLLGEERDPIANMANMASLLYFSLPSINWSGFYLFDSQELVLGPFHGKPACVRIQMGKGVCGTSAIKRETLMIENVHEFPGHIACDADSKSEIVIPMIKDDIIIGVLDIDSPNFARFDEDDKNGLQQLLEILQFSTDFTLPVQIKR
ncbi:MAG: GAF domain-containing protein [Ignavibacteriae bacterium]|nr:GAF domain-containing protein [Ignavibacteriota bacterium]